MRPDSECKVVSVISDRFNCIFVHIPKTAGQSIENFFLRLHGLSWETRGSLLLRFNPDPARGPERLAHLTAREYVDCGYVTAERFEAAFKFAFVRNPWDKVVSDYHYFGYAKRLSFKEFVAKRMTTRNRYKNATRHVMQQRDFIYDEAGNLLVDFVGRFESLQQDFDQICARLGIAETALPHSNRSSGKRSYSDYYDEFLLKQVGQIYAKDIETFGYQFGV